MLKRLIAIFLLLGLSLVGFAQEESPTNRFVLVNGLSLDFPPGYALQDITPDTLSALSVNTGTFINVAVGDVARFSDEGDFETADDVMADFQKFLTENEPGIVFSEAQEADFDGNRALFIEFTEESFGAGILLALELDDTLVNFVIVTESESLTEEELDTLIEVVSSAQFLDEDVAEDAVTDEDVAEDAVTDESPASTRGILGIQSVSDFPPNTVYMARGVEFTYPEGYIIEFSQTEVDDVVVLLREDFGVFVTVIYVSSADDIIEFILPAFIGATGITFDADALETVELENGITLSFFDGLSDLPEDASFGALYYIVKFDDNNAYAVQAQVISLDAVGDVDEEIFQIATTFQRREGADSGDVMVVIDGVDTAFTPIVLDCFADSRTYVSPDNPIVVAACPAGCADAGGSVWGGSEGTPFTSDSSVCVAAIHAGLSSNDAGGMVQLAYQEGADAYIGGESNGVTTSNWGSYGASFNIFALSTSSSAVVEVSCEARAYDFTYETGLSTIVTCPANCGTGSLWGTDVYTVDSNICSAAIHAGIITADAGGDVIVSYLDGEDSYPSTERNGITSSSWGSYYASFSVSAP